MSDSFHGESPAEFGEDLESSAAFEWARISTFLRASEAPLAIIEMASESDAEEVIDRIRSIARDDVHVFHPDPERDFRWPLDWLENHGERPGIFLFEGIGSSYATDEESACRFWTWANGSMPISPGCEGREHRSHPRAADRRGARSVRGGARPGGGPEHRGCLAGAAARRRCGAGARCHRASISFADSCQNAEFVRQGQVNFEVNGVPIPTYTRRIIRYSHGGYFFYLTNLPRPYGPRQTADIYRVRLEIECNNKFILHAGKNPNWRSKPPVRDQLRGRRPCRPIQEVTTAGGSLTDQVCSWFDTTEASLWLWISRRRAGSSCPECRWQALSPLVTELGTTPSSRLVRGHSKSTK